MPINFGFIPDGRTEPLSSDELKAKLPISWEMLDAMDRNDDLRGILSAISRAVVRLEARGVDFNKDGVPETLGGL